MSSIAFDLARRLAQQAEAVCRHYLPRGKRHGRYWTVGDVDGQPGRSLYVRLTGPDHGLGAAGKWTDAASGQHGDLLDLIAANRRLCRLRDVLDEARWFLRLPRSGPALANPPVRASAGTEEAARRLFAMSQPLPGTLAERYLAHRGIAPVPPLSALRFHPRCYYRDQAQAVTQSWPAMIAAVTDNADVVTGAHRTWLDPSGVRKASLETPRRAMGLLLGHAVRFGPAARVLLVGEGIETVLSLKCAFPDMAMAAALSANHLAALQLPGIVRVLYLARDRDTPGERAVDILAERARALGIWVGMLWPLLGDFNDDLRAIGVAGIRARAQADLTGDGYADFFRRETVRAAATGFDATGGPAPAARAAPAAF